jgi:hypothetical protein
MTYSTARRIALVATVLGIISNLGAPTILLCSWIGMSGPFIALGATSVMILTLALQIAFVTVQAFPNGRTPIPIQMMGQDAWLTVIILTALPGVLWHYLAALALPPMQLIMPGYVTPLVNVVLLVIVRAAQQRRSAGVRA